MKYAYSLAKSRIINACTLATSEYGITETLQYAERQYICPECFQPVYPRGIDSDSVSPHFAHFEKGTYSPDCQIRSNIKSIPNIRSTKSYIAESISKSDYAFSYLSCSSAYIMNTLSSILENYLQSKNFYIESVGLDPSNGKFKVSFTSNTPDFFFAPTYLLPHLLGGPGSQLIRDIAALIFPYKELPNNNLSTAYCGEILSPLVNDILPPDNSLNIDTPQNQQVNRSDLLCCAYINLAQSKYFKALREILIFSSLMETLFRYTNDLQIHKENNALYIDLSNDNFIEKLPPPIYKCLHAFNVIITLDSESESYHSASLLKNAAVLKSIRDRVLRFVHLLKFDTLDSSQMERVIFSGDSSDMGFLYIAHSSDLEKIYQIDSAVKIGRSKNPFKREASLTGQLLKEPITIKHTFRVKNQVVAEACVFRHLGKHRISSSREIFSLSIAKAIALSERALEIEGLLLNN